MIIKDVKYITHEDILYHLDVDPMEEVTVPMAYVQKLMREIMEYRRQLVREFLFTIDFAKDFPKDEN